MLRLVLLAALSCTVVLSAEAQGLAPSTAAAAASGVAPSARVQREASNPMRLIAEASRIRRNPVDAGSQAAPGAATARALARGSSLRVVGDAPPAGPGAIVERVSPLPPAAPAAPAETQASEMPPRIVSMVAPEFPASVLREVGSFHEITVQITILRDGTVGDVSLPSATFRALQPYVADALQRWRFEAPGEPRTQRLQLVFNH